MARIDELRDEYRRRRAAVTRKINRTAKINRVELSGTDYDPRRAVGSERQMTSRQLRSEIAKMNRFTKRTTQYYRGKDGAIIPRNIWLQYKGVENMVRNASKAELARLANLKTPSGDTVAEREAQTVHTMGGSASNRPLTPRNRTPAGVTSIHAISKLIRQENSRLSPAYKAKHIKSGRTSAIKMAEAVGDHATAKRIRKMDDERFYLAWNYGDLAEAQALTYHSVQSDGFEPDAGFLDDRQEQVNSILDWADAIDLEQYGDTAKARRKVTRR